MYSPTCLFLKRLQGAPERRVHQRPVPVFAASLWGAQRRWDQSLGHKPTLTFYCFGHFDFVFVFFVFFCQISRISWEPKLETQWRSTSSSALLIICFVFRWEKHESWLHHHHHRDKGLFTFSYSPFRNPLVTFTGIILEKMSLMKRGNWTSPELYL